MWSLAAAVLAREGHEITVLKHRIDAPGGRLSELAALGCRIVELAGPTWLPRKVRSAGALFWPIARRMTDAVLDRTLHPGRFDLAIISQGLNYDGLHVAAACLRRGLPYVLISQKADDLYWPTDGQIEKWRDGYRNTMAALFVSEHNLGLTQQQLGFDLPQGRVVRNPFCANWSAPLAWPAATDNVRLACVARLDTREKGQDLLLRVLAQPQWRARPVTLSLYGAGHNAVGLAGMTSYLGLDNVEFCGFTDTPERIWLDHHALVLPSRCEGLPLSLVEAMLSGRPAIITDAGGGREILIDGETGWLAPSATVAALDAAMERAWDARDRWPQIGRHAADVARARVPQDPAADLAAQLLAMTEGGELTIPTR